MTQFTILFSVLCAVLLFFSVYRYLNTALNARLKVVFITLRIIIILLLVLCFFEPVLTFNRLAPPKRSVAVLIDNSKSMQLFNPGSSLIPLLETITATASEYKKDFSVSYFTFGDSLQKIHPGTAPSFSDNHSVFPNLSVPQISSAEHLLILSDANWETNTAAVDNLTNRSVFYCALPDASRKPSLALHVQKIKSDTAGTVQALPLYIKGYTARDGLFTVQINEQKTTLRKIRFSCDSGSIDTIITAALPPQKPGKHLYRISVRSETDSLHAEEFILSLVAPEFFTYAFIKEQPSADSRFLSFALQQKTGFKKTETVSASTDLLIFSGANSSYKELIKKMSPSGVAAFLGWAPECDSGFTVPQDSRILLNMSLYTTPLGAMNASDYPPLSHIVRCKDFPSAQRTLISSIVKKGKGTDTIPVLVTGSFAGHSVLSLNGSGFWRWDFWPLSNNRGEEQPFLFSGMLLSTINEMLLFSSSGSFLSYPVNTSTHNDSMVFALSLPSDLPVPSGFSVAVTLTNDSYHHASSYTMTSTGSVLQYVNTPPLAPGSYAYSCKLTAQGKTYTCEDSLTVQAGAAEFFVEKQNRALLSQFSQPLTDNSSSSIEQLFQRLKSAERQAVQVHLKISRSWLLLLLLFGAFTVEWFLRRRVGLD